MNANNLKHILTEAYTERFGNELVATQTAEQVCANLNNDYVSQLEAQIVALMDYVNQSCDWDIKVSDLNISWYKNAIDCAIHFRDSEMDVKLIQAFKEAPPLVQKMWSKSYIDSDFCDKGAHGIYVFTILHDCLNNDYKDTDVSRIVKLHNNIVVYQSLLQIAKSEVIAQALQQWRDNVAPLNIGNLKTAFNTLNDEIAKMGIYHFSQANKALSPKWNNFYENQVSHDNTVWNMVEANKTLMCAVSQIQDNQLQDKIHDTVDALQDVLAQQETMVRCTARLSLLEQLINVADKVEVEPAIKGSDGDINVFLIFNPTNNEEEPRIIEGCVNAVPQLSLGGYLTTGSCVNDDGSLSLQYDEHIVVDIDNIFGTLDTYAYQYDQSYLFSGNKTLLEVLEQNINHFVVARFDFQKHKQVQIVTARQVLMGTNDTKRMLSYSSDSYRETVRLNVVLLSDNEFDELVRYDGLTNKISLQKMVQLSIIIGKHSWRHGHNSQYEFEPQKHNRQYFIEPNAPFGNYPIAILKQKGQPTYCFVKETQWHDVKNMGVNTALLKLQSIYDV